MTKRILAISMILITMTARGHADSLILKTGEVLRGKIVDRTDKSYYFMLDSGGDRVEVPVAKVSIADITPSPDTAHPKGSLIVFAKAGEDLTPLPVQSEQTYRPVEEASNKKSLFKMPGADIISKAETTVANANARTAEAQKQMEALKNIVDAANS